MSVFCVDVKDAARMMGVSPSTVSHLCAKGVLKATKLSGDGFRGSPWNIPVTQVETWIELRDERLALKAAEKAQKQLDKQNRIKQREARKLQKSEAKKAAAKSQDVSYEKQMLLMIGQLRKDLDKLQEKVLRSLK